MDYRALAELVMMALIGLSVLTVAVGFSVRMFLAPTLREIMGRKKGATEQEQALMGARIDAFEDRLEAIEDGVQRIAAASEFDRKLDAPKDS
jgi:hypothetical protein